MKKFIIRLLLFLGLPAIFGVATIVVVNAKVNEGHYFEIEANASKIILGHSHPECAFNDSEITDFKNLAQFGESYYYTYIKLKKVIENNRQVKVVFIEFTNNQIVKEFDNWIWDDKHISHLYPKYSSFMSFQDWLLLFSHNPGAVLKSISLSLRKNYFFLSQRKQNYIKESEWGGYLNVEKSIVDSLLMSMKKDWEKKDNIIGETSSINIRYLEKIIEYCKEKGKEVYLVRSPMHQKYTGLQNENEYKNILNSKFKDIQLLDFKNFPLNNNQFADLEHLNFKGAKIFSSFFNQLINDGLLRSTDKQSLINNSIEMYLKCTQDSLNYKIGQL